MFSYLEYGETIFEMYLTVEFAAGEVEPDRIAHRAGSTVGKV